MRRYLTACLAGAVACTLVFVFMFGRDLPFDQKAWEANESTLFGDARFRMRHAAATTARNAGTVDKVVMALGEPDVGGVDLGFMRYRLGRARLFVIPMPDTWWLMVFCDEQVVSKVSIIPD